MEELAKEAEEAAQGRPSYKQRYYY